MSTYPAATITVLDHLRTVGGRLEISRMNGGYTQEWVATQLKKPQSWVAKSEANTRQLLFSEALALAELYGVSVADFDPQAPMGQRRERYYPDDGALPEGALSDRVLERCLAAFGARRGLRMEYGAVERVPRGKLEIEERPIFLVAANGERVESGYREFVYPDGRNFSVDGVGQLLRLMAGPVRRPGAGKLPADPTGVGVAAARRRSQADHRALKALLGRSGYAELAGIFLHGPSMELLREADEAISREDDAFWASQEFGAGLAIDPSAITAAFPIVADEDDRRSTMTPRAMAGLALALHQVATDIHFETGLLIDEPVAAPTAGDDEYETESIILYRFPRPTYRASYAWRLRLAQAAEDLVGDILGGDLPSPRCPGEEAVLLLALDIAYSITDQQGADYYGALPPIIEQLPSASGGDYYWEALEMTFCPDELMRDFFDENEVPDEGYEPADWFHPFGDVEPRPDRETDPVRVTASLMLPAAPGVR